MNADLDPATPGPLDLDQIKLWRKVAFGPEPNTPAVRVARTQVDRLIAEVERLRGLLGRLEWSEPVAYGTSPVCPVCGRLQKHGHEADCWLAAELHRETTS
jgi:hypothetical protein